MSAPLKLAAFLAGLAALFGVATLAGAAIDPERDEPAPVHAGGMPSEKPAGHGDGRDEPPAAGETHAAQADADDGRASDAHGREAGGGEAHGSSHAAEAVRGLSATEHGLRLVVTTPELRRDEPARLAFRIVEEDGSALRDFDRTHERLMHLIVVRRDLTGFQHLHPRMAADGTWTAPVRLPEAGSYRLFADFSHDGEATTLAGDLRVDGAADLLPLPAPSPHATSAASGDAVTLSTSRGPAHGHGADGQEQPTAPARAGAEQELRFAIERDGRAVRPQPYLGADGHLVALREGDLAFLHVHPSGAGTTFATTFPSAGRYRLFLQYKVADRVETVAFTREVAP